jgi:GT2 family glycosyltransferase
MPWVNGACMFVRLDAVVDFGLMDENMFLFGSDADWCYRARERWWEVWYCAAAECIHEVGASAQVSRQIIEIRQRDMQYFHDKWVVSPQYPRLRNWPRRSR